MRNTDGSFSRGLKWGLLLAIPLWAIILFPLLAAEPPACRDGVCVMQGPGGKVRDWKLHVQLNDLRGARFVVPAGATCASACAIATGLGLYIGADFSIANSAVFVPHNRKAIQKETRMSHAFRELMLNNKPFHYGTSIGGN